jgi:hypothetical protein
MRLLPLLPLLLATATAHADEGAIRLKQAKGVEVVRDNCGACHSLDYPVMNSPFLDAKGWDATVTKMIKTFGAPIDDADAATIKAYLSHSYGALTPAHPSGASR